jgi:hypothetical protein
MAAAHDGLEALRSAVAGLVEAATKVPAGSALASDVEVIGRRMENVAALLGPATAGPDAMAPAVRTARHDLMNALGAIDNHAELILEDGGPPAAGAVRAAVADLVAAVRPLAG